MAGVSELTSLLVGSALMALLALVGGITLLLPRRRLQRLLPQSPVQRAMPIRLVITTLTTSGRG